MAKMRMDRMMKAAVGKYYSHFTNKLVNHWYWGGFKTVYFVTNVIILRKLNCQITSLSFFLSLSLLLSIFARNNMRIFHLCINNCFCFPPFFRPNYGDRDNNGDGQWNTIMMKLGRWFGNYLNCAIEENEGRKKRRIDWYFLLIHFWPILKICLYPSQEKPLLYYYLYLISWVELSRKIFVIRVSFLFIYREINIISYFFE
jgi:hypothetical protein